MTNMSGNRNPYPLGARPEADGICFSFVSETADCGILLYSSRTGRQLRRIPFSEEDRMGNIYCKRVEGIRPEAVTYQFYQGQEIVPDEHGRVFPGKYVYGKRIERDKRRAGFLPDAYDWEGDRRPEIPYSEAICYCIHVRGFTKHSSSAVKNRGTFDGIREKIPYLREIGVTTLELQPAYEFEEAEEKRDENLPPYCVPETVGPPEKERKVNYWGYKKGYYYAPKAAYAASGDAPEEFRRLIRELHKNHMELVMQFYFPEDVDRNEITEILRFWTLEYHVDGFHLMGGDLPLEMLAADPLLSDRKMMYYGFGRETVYDKMSAPKFPHLAEYNDGYLYDMRRLLKGDDNMLGSALRHMRYIPEKAGRIHYLTNYYGFTLADLVSYDYKHNEANGEENRDGNEYNCSWNCGEEGGTRSRRVRQLRIKQIKNAICMLLLTQSTPLIFMGDEFGNTQRGNNNPWCQDNGVCWLDWGKKNSEILEFWKQTAAFRKKHPILHPESPLQLMDHLSCGYPDLSYHGESAWRARIESHSRHIGIMLCGKYVQSDKYGTDDFIYIAMNMHWESHWLALPKLPKGMCWRMAFATAETADPLRTGEEESPDSGVTALPRSIVVLISAQAEQKTETGGGKRGRKA
ncbi:MAG: alpha-amylase family glycosyl hydrolase [Firmicutes bacterium]|nr:alpha-amylase family glycosyl hydrolase [Bacillota bacterium]